MDIYTIIFLALAVFIFLRLRNVLGQRTGNERPPYDRPARNVVQGAQDNNVVPMPGAVLDQAPLAPTAEVTRFRHWYLEQIHAQLGEAAPPRPFPE